jgi:hypothetical protein
LTDRLSLTNALADANIDRQKAERIATEIFDAIHNNVASKQDLQLVKAELEARIDRVVVRLGSLMVVLTGLLFAALHYWPADRSSECPPSGRDAGRILQDA